MSEEIKEFKVTADAFPKSRRSSSTRKRRQNGGDNSGALMQLAAQSGPANVPDPNAQSLASQFQAQVGQVLANNFGPDKQWGGRKGQRGGDVVASSVVLASSRAPTLPDAPAAVPVVSGISPSQPAPVGGGRVVLAPPKRKTRIALKAKKLKGGSTSTGMGDLPPIAGGTRKARKIHLRVKGVTARLAKAKKAKKQAMEAPLSTVRSRLESAGVVKKGSKAPEKMLRTMYADLLITKKGL